MIGVVFKSCEEMEVQIKVGGDLYNDWLQVVKGVDWKMNMMVVNIDIVDVKKMISISGGSSGVLWVGGIYVGGSGQVLVCVVKDIVVVGYNVMLNIIVIVFDMIDYLLFSSFVVL